MARTPTFDPRPLVTRSPFPLTVTEERFNAVLEGIDHLIAVAINHALDEREAGRPWNAESCDEAIANARKAIAGLMKEGTL